MVTSVTQRIVYSRTYGWSEYFGLSAQWYATLHFGIQLDLTLTLRLIASFASDLHFRSNRVGMHVWLMASLDHLPAVVALQLLLIHHLHLSHTDALPTGIWAHGCAPSLSLSTASLCLHNVRSLARPAYTIPPCLS